MRRLTEAELNYLEQVAERAKERCNGFFGPMKTTGAETAEMILVAFAPALIADCRSALAQSEDARKKGE